jgi:hypothetical protein
MDSEHQLSFGSFDDVDSNAVSADHGHMSLDETPYGDAGVGGHDDGGSLHHHPVTGAAAEDGQHAPPGDAADLTYGSGEIHVNAQHAPVISALLETSDLPALVHHLGDFASEVKIPVAGPSGVTLEPLDDYIWQGGKE